LAGANEAVPGGVGDRVEAEGRPSPALFVRPHQRAQVEVGKDVAVQGDESPLEVVLGELDRPGRAPRLGLSQVAQTRAAGLAIAELLTQRVWHETAGEDHLLHPMARQPIDHVGDQRPVDERDDRLRDRLG
jgi:hypothetical protein